MKRTDLAYTAGIIDGEGCIRIGRAETRKCIWYALYVDVASTDEWLPMWLKFAYGGSVRGYPHPAGNFQWRWTISAKQARGFLEAILPYLHLKRPQAEIAIQFQARKRRWGIGLKPQSETILDEADKILLMSMHSAKKRQANVNKEREDKK